MPKYEYTGDADAVFISLVKDGHTWLASKGDTIEVDEPIAHAHLRLVEPEQSETPDAAVKPEEN